MLYDSENIKANHCVVDGDILNVVRGESAYFRIEQTYNVSDF
jgi:hypothetical protein